MLNGMLIPCLLTCVKTAIKESFIQSVSRWKIYSLMHVCLHYLHQFINVVVNAVKIMLFIKAVLSCNAVFANVTIIVT